MVPPKPKPPADVVVAVGFRPKLSDKPPVVDGVVVAPKRLPAVNLGEKISTV